MLSAGPEISGSKRTPRRPKEEAVGLMAKG